MSQTVTVFVADAGGRAGSDRGPYVFAGRLTEEQVLAIAKQLGRVDTGGYTRCAVKGGQDIGYWVTYEGVSELVYDVQFCEVLTP